MLPTIRHVQRWKAIAPLATVMVAIVLAAITPYFASIATVTAGALGVIVFLALSHHFLGMLYGHEANSGWTSLIEYLPRWPA